MAMPGSQSSTLCGTCKKNKPIGDFANKRNKEKPWKTCASCREKAKARKEGKKVLKACSLENEDTDPEGGTKTRSKSRYARSEGEKKRSSEMYRHMCPMTGNMGPSVQMAHLIPWSDDDTYKNIVPMRGDLHLEYDASFPLWTFDPNNTRESSKPGFMQLGIILSDKGHCDKSSCRHFEDDFYDIRTESLPFIKEAYKRFIDKIYPERSIEVGQPTFIPQVPSP